MKFVPRTKAPSKTNKYYININYGGYDRAMVIDKKTGSCLSNCCGLVHGRFLEAQKQTNYKKYDKLCTGNAKSYYGYTKDGYKRSKTPEVGDVACWSGGNSGCGHVAFVEKTYKNGDFECSNSAYDGSRFFIKKILKSKKYAFGKNYKFLGFIKNPTKFGEDEPKKVYYIVKKGDNLTKIAKKYKTSVEQLVKWNKIKNPDIINAGQKLRVK